MKIIDNSTWVFHGAQEKFSSGVFTSIDIAEEWIKKHCLSGMLTAYPTNEGVYDWAISNNYFEVTKDNQKQSNFIQGFTTTNQQHYHYEDGERE